VGPAPPHPGLDDPFRWTISQASEGDETSQSQDPYPAIDLHPDVIEFRRFSVEYFGLYIANSANAANGWNGIIKDLHLCLGAGCAREDNFEELNCAD